MGKTARIPAYLPEVSATDFEVRNEIRKYAIEESDTWFRQYLEILYSGWESFNESYFEGEMRFPLILIAEPSSPRALGDCAIYNGFGGRSQIRIRPKVLTGEHRVFAQSEPSEGVRRYYLDVLLHEMVHQWQHEVLKLKEETHRGHGPFFTQKCNEIGEIIGLDPVGHRKPKSGIGLPRCSYWPMIVRPEEYYLGVLTPSVHQARTVRRNKKKTTTANPETRSVLDFIRNLPTQERGVLLQKLWGNFSDELIRYHQGEDPSQIWKTDDWTDGFDEE